MLSTSINRFGYIIDTTTIKEHMAEMIKKDLEVTPEVAQKYNFGSDKNSFKLYRAVGNKLKIPKFYGVEKFGLPTNNLLEMYDYPQHNCQYKGNMRPKQEIIINKIMEGFNNPKIRGGVLVAGCGSGKTNMAIYLGCLLKLNVLFVVHKTFLKNQAIDRIKTFTDCKKVGIIQGQNVDVDAPFVIGMVQSLTKIDYEDHIFKNFGLIIIDEVHHMGAKSFSKFFMKCTAKYMLGITAEQQRNDGLFKIINWFMGPFLHIEKQIPNDNVVVKCMHFKPLSKGLLENVINQYIDDIDRSTMISNLTKIKSRNDFIFNIIGVLFDEGRNILFLSGRLKHLHVLFNRLDEDERYHGSVGLYLGGMSEEELAESGTKQIILGSYQMAEEGLDIKELNVVILGTPKSKINQSVGRILRKEEYDEPPIVIDIIDDNPIYYSNFNKRTEYYRDQNYNIKNYHVYCNDEDIDGRNDIHYQDIKGLTGALIEIPPKKTFAPVINKTEMKINLFDL